MIINLNYWLPNLAPSPPNVGCLPPSVDVSCPFLFLCHFPAFSLSLSFSFFWAPFPSFILSKSTISQIPLTTHPLSPFPLASSPPPSSHQLSFDGLVLLLPLPPPPQDQCCHHRRSATLKAHTSVLHHTTISDLCERLLLADISAFQ